MGTQTPAKPDYYLDLLNGLDANVWVSDAATLQRSFVTRYAETYIGHPKADWLKPGFWQSIVHPEDRPRAVSEALLRPLKENAFTMEYRLLGKDQRVLWVRDAISVVRDAAGKPRELRGIMRDETEQVRMTGEIERLNSELELRVAERTAQLETANRELDSFSYSVSHDLQAPLRKIDGFGRLLLHEHAERLGDGARVYCEKILDATQAMSRLIDALLNLARVVRGTMRREHVNLGVLAREAVDELARMHPERKVEYKGQDDLVVMGDRQLLGIALYNLLDNAWKFTAKTKNPVIEFGSQGGVPPVYFVRDNGAGFDMAFVGKLFREFSRLHDPREYRGTGIGLATVQRIVRRHAGEIWAESKPNEGTTFYFSLGSDS